MVCIAIISSCLGSTARTAGWGVTMTRLLWWHCLNSVSRSHEAAVGNCAAPTIIYYWAVLIGPVQRGLRTLSSPWKLFLPWMIKRKWSWQRICHCALLYPVFWLPGQCVTSVMRSRATLRLQRCIRILRSFDGLGVACCIIEQCTVVYLQT